MVHNMLGLDYAQTHSRAWVRYEQALKPRSRHLPPSKKLPHLSPLASPYVGQKARFCMWGSLVRGRTRYQKRCRRGRWIARKGNRESHLDPHLIWPCRRVEGAKLLCRKILGSRSAQQEDLCEGEGEICACALSCQDDGWWKQGLVEGTR